MFVLTRAINEYYQDGHYLVSVFENKPSKEQLRQMLAEDAFVGQPIPENELSSLVEHLLAGGGRRKNENEWYYLTELAPGAKYSSNCWC